MKSICFALPAPEILVFSIFGLHDAAKPKQGGAD